jgi:Na+-driven multidrug efflux pump
MMKLIVIWAAVAAIAMVLAGILAGAKNRDYSAWMAWGFLFPPALFVLVLLPKLKGPRPRQRTLDEEDAALDQH